MITYEIALHRNPPGPLFQRGEKFITVENEQNNGWCTRGSIKIQKDFEHIALVIEPFVRYWNIGRSSDSALTYDGTYIGYAYESKNNSLEIGNKIAILF